ncbi:hypothetical protein J7J37_01000 [bacterium]|nr:hypothetical protein [bacterium]
MSHNNFFQKVKEIIVEKLYDLKWFFLNSRKEIIVFIIVFLFSTISFALGYLFCYYYTKVPTIIIQKNSSLNNWHYFRQNAKVVPEKKSGVI